MFKKKPSISPPFNFEHRVHTNFNAEEGRYEGLPVQWTSIVSNRPRPTPFIDSDTITPVSFEDRIVRGSQRRKDISRSNSLREERGDRQHGHPISHRPNLSKIPENDISANKKPENVKRASGSSGSYTVSTSAARITFQSRNSRKEPILSKKPENKSNKNHKESQHRQLPNTDNLKSNFIVSKNPTYKARMQITSGPLPPSNECSLESQEASLESPESPPIHMNNSNHQIPSKKSVRQPKGKKTAISHDEFKAALQEVVCDGDPTDCLTMLKKIGEGSTAVVYSALEKKTKKSRSC